MKTSESTKSREEKMFPTSVEYDRDRNATPAPARSKIEAPEPLEGWRDPEDPKDRRPVRVMVHPKSDPDALERSFTVPKSLLQLTRRGPAADAMSSFIAKSNAPLADAEAAAERLLGDVSTALEAGRFTIGERSALASVIFTLESAAADPAQQAKWREETRKYASRSYGPDAGRRLEALRDFVSEHPSFTRVQFHPDFAKHLLERADDLR